MPVFATVATTGEGLFDALLERLVFEDGHGDGLDVRIRLPREAVAAGERRGEEQCRDQADECAGSGFWMS